MAQLGAFDGSMSCREYGRDLMEVLFRNFPGKSAGATSKIGMCFLTIEPTICTNFSNLFWE